MVYYFLALFRHPDINIDKTVSFVHRSLAAILDIGSKTFFIISEIRDVIESKLIKGNTKYRNLENYNAAFF